MVSSSIASTTSGIVIFFEIIASAIMGITILKNFQFSLMETISQARSGQMTQQEFIRTNVSRAMGAVFLIIPGFFTDIIGILMLIGFLPFLVSKMFEFKTPNQTKTNQTNFNNTTYKGVKNEEIIDVEIIDDSHTIK